MNSKSTLDRMVLQGLALCLLTAFLAGCMASAAVTVVSQTAKTTARAAGTAARITMDGARAASNTISKPFRRGENENSP